MSGERLDSLCNSRVTSHLLLFTGAASGAEAGVATLYTEANALAYYSYAFYDLNHPVRDLGMFMMTTANTCWNPKPILQNSTAAIWQTSRVPAGDSSCGKIEFNRDLRPVLSENCIPSTAQTYRQFPDATP